MLKLSRRGMLVGTAVTLFAATTQRGWAQTAITGGTMTHIIPGAIASLDPHASQSMFTMLGIGGCYSTLLRFDTETFPEIAGDLAERWEVSDDLKTYTFHLQAGVTFHDGTAFTAEDVRASYERIITPPAGVITIRGSELSGIDTIEVVDPLTLRITMKEVNVAMALNFANPWNVIYSAAKLAEDPNYPATTPMGTGPFRFVEYTPGTSIRVERNPDYFVEGLPHLDAIVGNFVTGPAVTSALSAGQADAMLQFVTPQQMQSIRDVQGDGMVFDEATMNSIVFATFNAAREPLSDPRVRQALNLAVDRYTADRAMAAVSVMMGATAYFAPGSEFTPAPEELQTLPGYATDIDASRAQARALLAEAGHSNLTLRMISRNLPPFDPPSVFMVDQWRQIGVSVEIVKLDTPVYFASLASGDFDMALEGYNSSSMDPVDVFSKFLPGSTLNYANYEDQVLVDLFAALKSEPDGAARREMALEYQRRLLSEAYYAPLLWNRRITVSRATLRGWRSTPVLGFIGRGFSELHFVS